MKKNNNLLDDLQSFTSIKRKHILLIGMDFGTIYSNVFNKNCSYVDSNEHREREMHFDWKTMMCFLLLSFI